MNDHRATGIVLAGGRSRRMGADKRRIPIAGTPMLERVVRVLQAVCPAVLVTVGDGDAGVDAGGAPGLQVIRDRLPGRGPLGGLHAGLQAMGTPYGLVVACDLPFLQPGLLGALLDLAAASGAQATVPVVGGRMQPLVAVYHRDVARAAEEVLDAGPASLRDLLARIGVRYVVEEELRVHDPQLLSFLNVNTPADLARAAALAGSPVAPDHGSDLRNAGRK